jgi:ribosomal protein S18 acetylase RimI-like enzyme
MTLAAIPIKPEKKNERAIKPRVEQITVTHIVDAWRLLDRSIKDTHEGYPDLSEESPEKIRAHLYQFISSSNFMGLMLKVGRKPVGHILGRICHRPFGKPERYCFIWNFWIEPEFRKKGMMKTLYQAYFNQLKSQGVFHWEAEARDELTQMLTEYAGYKTEKRYNLIGGKIG